MITANRRASATIVNDQNAIASFSAHRYWSGASTPIPKWEFVLNPPVRVIEEVT